MKTPPNPVSVPGRGGEAIPPRLSWWKRELFRLRYRLLLVNVLIVSVPLAGIGFARFYEREMLGSLENDMIHQGQLFREVLLADDAGLNLAARESLLRAAARNTRTRIRLLDAKGRLFADSHRQGPPEGPESGRRPTQGRVGITPVKPSLNPYPKPSPGMGPAVVQTDVSTLGASNTSSQAPSQTPSLLPSARPLETSIRPLKNFADRVEVRRALRGRYGATTRVWTWEKGARHATGGERVYLFCALPVRRADVGPVEAVVYLTRSTTPVLASMYRLRGDLVRVLQWAMASTVILSLFLAGTISRPLARLGREARRLSFDNRTMQASLRRHDEIGDLARIIDAMARQLQKRGEDAAELAANISHEFKSPLTSLRGAAELLIEQAGEDPTVRRKFLGNMLEDTHRLDRLVTRLLELSRLDADRTPVQDVDWEVLLEQAKRHHSTPNPVKLVYQSSRKLIPGRRGPLLSAVGNLLSNAQAFADPGTTVTITVQDAGTGVYTDVHNHGPPISTLNQKRIWDRFFTSRANSGGTGLGLPIVISVTESHGGRVTLQSGEDGTTFSMYLPVTFKGAEARKYPEDTPKTPEDTCLSVSVGLPHLAGVFPRRQVIRLGVTSSRAWTSVVC